MQVINETYEKPVQVVSDDGRYKVGVDYDSYRCAQEAVDCARRKVEEYEKSARSVILRDLEARGVLMPWRLESLVIPQGLGGEEADEWLERKRQEKGFSAGRLVNDIFDDSRSDSMYYIFAPASDTDIRDLCVLLGMCGAPLADSLAAYKYSAYCGQAQVKKGSRYLVQLGACSDFPKVEWVRVIDMGALKEGVKALAEFVKDFK